MVREFYGLLKTEFKLRPRQEEALPLIESDDDFIVVAPTGIGKTFIGSVAIAKELSRGKQSVVLSPLKTLTAEQTKTFRSQFPNHRVVLDDGDHRKDMNQYGDWDIAELTYERFSSLLNREESRKIFNNLGLIIIDEVHNFGNNSRGATLESAMIKIRVLFPNVKIIGLSATIDNPEEFASDLNTKLILAQKSERPVPLKIRVVSYKDNWNGRLNLLARVDMLKALLIRHPNKTMLVFTTSRARTKQVIEALADRKYITLSEALFNHKMGWHNAGMKIEDKTKVERLFRQGKIKIIACTPTLAMGVNLPADICVMFDMFQWSYLTGSSIIEKDRLEQTIGRAGRPGLSKIGYAYIFTTYRQKEEVIAHLKNPLLVRSQLKNEIRAKVLEWIVAKIVDDNIKLKKLMKFFIDKSISWELLLETIDWLSKHRFISEVKSYNNKFIPTFKGRMTAYLMIQPETVLHWERVLYKKENLTNAELFCLIASAPEYASIVVPYKHDNTKIEYAKQYIGGNPEILKYFRVKIGEYDYINFTRQIYKIFALTYHQELMTKYNLSKKDFAMSYGDKYIVINASLRYLNAASILCQNFKDQLTELMIGAKHNIISGGIIELSKLKGIGDIRLKLLLNDGIDSVEKLLSTSNKKLSGILKLKEESIIKLKKSTVMFL